MFRRLNRMEERVEYLSEDHIRTGNDVRNLQDREREQRHERIRQDVEMLSSLREVRSLAHTALALALGANVALVVHLWVT